MDVVTDQIVAYCVRHSIISVQDEDWFRYGIKKRLTLVLCLIPQVALASLMSDFQAALAFMICFLQLRERTSGYHAKTPIGCMCMAVAVEFAFFFVMFQRLNFTAMLISNILCTGIIFLLAPYSHPQMHFTQDELSALRQAAKTTTLAVALAAEAFQVAGFHSIARGLTIGVEVTAFALCLAYTIDILNLEGNR